MTDVLTETNTTLRDVRRLRDERDWSYTRIGGHYGVSQRQVRRWVDPNNDSTPPEELSPPVELDHFKIHVLSDTQYPYMDKPLWEVACQIGRDNGVEEAIFDGDIFDFENMGSYAHNPYRINTADEDVENGWRDMLTPYVSSVPSLLRKKFVPGNHEWRYVKYVDRNAGAVTSFPAFRDFLRIPEDWEFHPQYGKAEGVEPADDLLVSHGWRANKYAERATLRDIGFAMNVIIGHTHRAGLEVVQTLNGPIRCWMIGHMADTGDLPKSISGFQNWTKMAGALITVARDGSYFDVELCTVLGEDEDVVIANDSVYRVDR